MSGIGKTNIHAATVKPGGVITGGRNRLPEAQHRLPLGGRRTQPGAHNSHMLEDST
jgi:hypothetical protein